MNKENFVPSSHNSNLKKEQSKEKTPENFLKISHSLLKKLDECEEQLNKNFVKTYGNFSERTTAGKDILIRTICATGESDRQKNLDLHIKENIELIAMDPTTKEILGIRRQDITYGPFVGSLLSGGEIVTKNRGQGIATVIEKTLIKVLQKFIDRYQTENHDIPVKITWIISNENKNDLDCMVDKYSSIDKTDASKEELEEKKEEQKRWLALYGKNGKFGTVPIIDSPYNLMYEKEFQPQAEELDLKTINPEDYHEVVKELRKFL